MYAIRSYYEAQALTIDRAQRHQPIQPEQRARKMALQQPGMIVGRKVRMVGHLVTVKYIKTVKREWMNFGCFIDCDVITSYSIHYTKLYDGHNLGVAIDI